MKKKIVLTVLMCFVLPVSVSASASDVVYSMHTNEKNVALTFDDGPHPRYTPEILELLAEYNIKATFFTVGKNAELYSELIRAEYEAGHEIGNHTYSHQNMKKLNEASILTEIKTTEEIVLNNTNFRTTLIRPPGGLFGEALKNVAESEDYTVICWSVDTLDWSHTPSEQIVQNVLSSVKGGDIILFHDFVSGASPTPEALRILIPALIDEGYEFVTVSELMGIAHDE